MNGGDDVLRDGARIECRRAILRDSAQCRCVFRIGAAVAHGQRLAIREEVRRRCRVFAERAGLVARAQRVREARGDDEAVIRQLDRGLEVRRPWLLAILVVRRLVERDGARCPHRLARQDRLHEAKVLTIDGEIVRGRRGGRCLAAVEHGRCVGLAIVDNHVATAAKAGALRLDKAKHGVGGDGSVNRAAAPVHRGDGGFDGALVSGGRHGAMREAPFAFRRRGRLRGRRACAACSRKQGKGGKACQQGMTHALALQVARGESCLHTCPLIRSCAYGN